MMSPIENVIMSNIPLETILTFFVAMFLIFIGINEDIDTKKYQKKSILIMYSLLFFITYFLDNILLGFLFFILLLYGSGISYLQSDKLSFERELNVFQLFHYTTSYWIFHIKSYILIFALISIVILKSLNSSYPIKFIDYLLIATILFFFFIHYIQNTRDYFSTLKWEKIKEKIQTNSSTFIIHQEIQNLSFLYYMEDKNLFKRKSFTFRISDFIKGALKNIKLFFLTKQTDSSDSKKNKLSIWQKNKKIWKKIKRSFRGYSTIEQQVMRRTAMGDNSYRYKVRRKLFIERTLNKNLGSAWCKLISKEYKKTDRKNAKYQLRFSLKYHYLRYYYIVILDNPKNINELISKMSKESSLSQETYHKEYTNYKQKNFVHIYENQLKNVIINEEKYAIIKKPNAN